MSETYSFDQQTLTLIDSELALNVSIPFAPVLLPDSPEEGQQIDGYQVRVLKWGSPHPEQAFVEKNRKKCGQWKLFYPNQAVKMEAYYLEGKLHGPSYSYTETGTLLAVSWFLEGVPTGKRLWYYPDGTLYARQRYRKGVWDGLQEFFHPDGTVKSQLRYAKGLLEGTTMLYHVDGTAKKTLTYRKGIFTH